MVFKRGVFFIALLMGVLLLPWRLLNDHLHNRWITDDPVVSLVYPAMASVASVKKSASVWIERVFQGSSDKEVELAEKLERALAENILIKARLNELSADTAMAKSMASLTRQLIPARILSYDILPAAKTVFIDKGALHGVAVDDVAMSADGLVGRIIRTYRETSKVLLCVDPTFAVDAVNSRTGMRAVVSGTGGRTLVAGDLPFLSRIEYVEDGREIRAGDAFTTSGLGGVFPPGIPVGIMGRLTEGKDQGIESLLVSPAVDFTRLTRMYVVVRDAMGDSLAVSDRERER